MQSARFRDAGITIHVLDNVDPASGLRAGIRRALAVRRFIRSHKYELVHLHNYSENAVFARLGGVLAGHRGLLTYDHDIRQENWKDKVAWTLLNPFTRMNITISDACSEFRMKNCGGQKSKVKKVLNGIETGLFAPVSSRDSDSARERLGLPVDQKIVLACGRLVPHKRFHLFVEVANSLGEDSGITFVLRGAGPEKEHLESMIKQRGLTRKFVILDWVDDQRDLYAAADVLVITSDSTEGFGLVAAEGMLSGLPVVAVETPTMWEVLSGSRGTLVAADATSIAEGVQNALIGDEATESKLKEAIAYARREFDIVRTADQLAGLYEKVLN